MTWPTKPSRKTSSNQREPDGYVLILVIFTGLILAIGAMVIAARSFDGLIKSGRQKQKSEAVDIAEIGVNNILDELNSNYPSLLTVNCKVENNSVSEQFNKPYCTGWDQFTLGKFGGPTSTCPGRSTKPWQIIDDQSETLYKTINNNSGAYRLRNYEFLGDQSQGGTAIIQVQGQQFKKGDTSSLAASAILEQEVTIVPKCCNKAPYAACSSSGWGYGLATKNIALQLGDIIDEVRPTTPSGANVHCVNCDEPPPEKCEPWTSAGQKITVDCSAFNQESLDEQLTGAGVIDGERSSGEIDFPTAPTWEDIRDADGKELPDNLKNLEPWSLYYQAVTIGHDSEPGNFHPEHCITVTETSTNKKTTHCRILNINASGTTTLTVKPQIGGKIIFYMEGQQINLSGENSFKCYIEDPVTGEELPCEFGQFVIYGGASTYTGQWPSIPDTTQYACGQKDFNLSGGGAIDAFLHMPCFNVNLSGGNETYPITIKGAVIANDYDTTGDYARLIVPTGAGSIICNNYKICSSGSSKMEFIALGSNRWSLIQMNSKDND
ncbi:hypothetical protein SynBIOSE41_00770 [Synechococcus sp. BIOS-E4-1]|uniref:type IV pilus modification PilV family protein n=1 Tax=Synechococcus sp. BIOS-E4-1 TaxID=1400864 RepID=UPI001647A425|nr:hypothetical protein [Synechococcus sp. BIOS-E4-1]QNI53305.1 hypothetical protein SynBIOSE41_00770 [Synechococcus sp. BIOS-E4-1]